MGDEDEDDDEDTAGAVQFLDVRMTDADKKYATEKVLFNIHPKMTEDQLNKAAQKIAAEMHGHGGKKDMHWQCFIGNTWFGGWKKSDEHSYFWAKFANSYIMLFQGLRK